MSTILFRMDGTPFVVPATTPPPSNEQPSPKIKSVNFKGVRPISIDSVQSVRGDRVGEPPLAGEEESDIDDSCLHLAEHEHSGPSRAPTVSPVKEVSTPPSPRASVDEDNKGDKEVESPLLDQSSAGNGQKCCTIL
ncbi:hypothetical protein QZH41_001685 [Actinostola sp. cb2023]|nr:hypothetical protein QZH41_001685 [Actinostola sp. cb2023]